MTQIRRYSVQQNQPENNKKNKKKATKTLIKVTVLAIPITVLTI